MLSIYFLLFLSRRRHMDPLLVAASLFLIFGLISTYSMESNHVSDVSSYQQLVERTVTVPSDAPDSVGPMDLVHVTGPLQVDETLSDETFDVDHKTLKLQRKVEVFQWLSVNDDFQKDWSSRLVGGQSELGDPRHQNPTERIVEAQSMRASEARIGTFSLSDELISQVDADQTVQLDTFDSDNVSGALADEISEVRDQSIYIGGNQADPDVGDHRVSFRSAGTGTYTALARYQTRKLEPAGIETHRDSPAPIVAGELSQEDMLAQFRPQRSFEQLRNALLALMGLLLGPGVWFSRLKFGTRLPSLARYPILSALTAGSITGGGLAAITYGAVWLDHHPVASGAVIVTGVVGLLGGLALAYKYREGNKPSKDFDWESADREREQQ